MRRHARDIAFVVLATLALGVGVLAALIWSGHFVSDAGPTVARTQGPTIERAAPSPPPPPPRLVTTRAPRPTVPTIEIYASRGDCWVSAHKGSQAGATLVERVLRQGETVRLRGRRIWLQLGAAGNVDLTVDGKDRPIPNGTTDVVLG